MTLIVFLKLIAHPLIFLGAVMVFGVTPDLAVIGLVLTALPVANNVLSSPNATRLGFVEYRAQS